MKSFIRNKKGVTPVLSNILLTVIAVAAMSLATTATYVITENMRQMMGERLIVEDVWFTQEGISVYLRNIGKVQIQVSMVYLNSSSGDFPQLALEVGEHQLLEISGSWIPGSLYHLSIVTTSGNSITDFYKAPL